MLARNGLPESLLPSPVLGLALMLIAPLAAGQDTLGAILDQGAVKISAEEFRHDLIQRTVVGTTPGGGLLEVMYGAGGRIAGAGLPTSSSMSRAPLDGTWTIDELGRVCTTLFLGNQGGAGGGFGATLPRRCQFWFKLGDGYFLSESDSDRHAKVVRRTVASAAVVPASSAPLELPKSLKGVALWDGGGVPRLNRATVPLAVSITRTDADGTFEGVVTFVAPLCNARDIPIANGVVRGGEVRFSAPVIGCEMTFTLRRGTGHLLEGDADVNVPGAVPARVWLDPSP